MINTPAYIIEASIDWITYVPVKLPSTESGDKVLVKRGNISYKEISMYQMVDYNKQIGKGYQLLLVG
nr:hypothetical protein [Flavihumibacter fluvii]